jgi:DNA repair exonuclease SbcCD ATPase subunit
MSESNNNGWVEYGKLVLKELERLNDNYESLKRDLDSRFNELKQEISTVKTVEDKVKKLEDWKEKVDDVISPSQLKDLRDEVASQKSKWTSFLAIAAAIQILGGVVMFLLTYLKK